MKIVKKDKLDVKLLPEYGSFMIEATPAAPYENYTSDLLKVEKNMTARRKVIESVVDEDVYLFTLGSFPLLGCDDHQFLEDKNQVLKGPIANSQYVSDAVINPHPRFGCLTQNIRERRGENVDIRIPIFRDEKTDPKVKDIHMDAMVFGMGCSCLQVTFQARNLFEARCLYDQLATMTPIMMALSASTPFYRGFISDIDCRWTVISQSVDDRTEAERGVKKEKGVKEISKSRYDTIDYYICECQKRLQNGWNDIDLVYDEKAYKQLIEGKVDDRLAKHIAHLWIRDPLVIYKERVEVDDKKQLNILKIYRVQTGRMYVLNLLQLTVILVGELNFELWKYNLQSLKTQHLLHSWLY
eukprot:UN30184